MSDYITLLGAEQVQNAARNMQSAADTMSRAASEIDGALFRHRQFLDDWLYRLEQVMNPPSSPEPESPK